MSKIITHDVSENFKTWKAPALGVNDDSSYDYKIDKLDNITDREQHERIRQQSYEKSYHKGYMEGLAKGQREMNDQVRNLYSVMAALAMPLPSLDDNVVRELAQLSMTVVKQMVRRELTISPDEVVAVVREALNILPATEAKITLELHPADAKLIKESFVSSDDELSWSIIEDPLLTRGGCRVSTNTSRIDATVENRMNAVIAEVMGGERKEDES